MIYVGGENMIKTMATRIYPTETQIKYFQKAFGIRRWVYNWAIDEYFNTFNETNKSLSDFDLNKILNQRIRENPELEFLTSVNSMVRYHAIRDFRLSVEVYWRKWKNRSDDSNYYNDKYKPRYKSKKDSKNTFTINNKNEFRFDKGQKRIGIPYIVKNNRLYIQCAENVSFLSDKSLYRICNITITERGGLYFIFIKYEEKANVRTKQNSYNSSTKEIGIDMGVRTPFTCATNDKEIFKIYLPKSLQKAEKKTKRLQRIVSRKVKHNKENYYSNRFKKAVKKLNRSYLRENNIKKDFREKFTTYLVKNYDVIKVEKFDTDISNDINYNTRKRIKNAINRIGSYEFLFRLEQKCVEKDKTLILVEHGTPTTQTCSSCGYRLMGDEKLSIKNRVFRCPCCKEEYDRDVNAAINILKY